MKIVSFQSAVAFGHVGNSAAVFPLQLLGFDAWPVDSVQFSNHPGYGGWSGGPMPAAHMADMVEGLSRIGALAQCDAVLSGYLGEADTAEAVARAVKEVKAARSQALYLCDPVMGDDGTGLYVSSGIPEAFTRTLLPLADIVTPNRFELEHLSGRTVASMADAAAAARTLLAHDQALVVVTSLDGAAGRVACLAVTARKAWAVETPRIDFPIAPNGAGDTLAALLLGHLLRGCLPSEALSLALSGLYGVLAATRRLDQRELALVAAQGEIVRPSHIFPAAELSL
ncbi:Pyridoxamine kinase [Candidatus Terasakiella magnetica]|nr:Pyridoxamine kinase [Candidatus Terasakiella magnetica]